jgi:hypothetical protein
MDGDSEALGARQRDSIAASTDGSSLHRRHMNKLLITLSVERLCRLAVRDSWMVFQGLR